MKIGIIGTDSIGQSSPGTSPVLIPSIRVDWTNPGDNSQGLLSIMGLLMLRVFAEVWPRQDPSGSPSGGLPPTVLELGAHPSEIGFNSLACRVPVIQIVSGSLRQ
jgi:hypothetical protein